MKDHVRIIDKNQKKLVSPTLFAKAPSVLNFLTPEFCAIFYGHVEDGNHFFAMESTDQELACHAREFLNLVTLQSK